MTTSPMFKLPDIDLEDETEPVLEVEPGTAGTGSENREPEPACAPEPVPGTTEAGSEPAGGTTVPGSGTGSELVPTRPARPPKVSRAEDLLLSMRTRLARFADDQKTHRTLWHKVWEAVWVKQPESFAAHRAHLKSKAWLEPWMDGWVRVAFDKQNILFGFLVAFPAKCACRAVVFAALNAEKLFDRQYRFWIAFGVFLPCFIIYLLNH